MRGGSPSRFTYRECGRLSPFIETGKPAMVIEYDLARADFCDRAVKLGMFAMRKRLSLGWWRRPCES